MVNPLAALLSQVRAGDVVLVVVLAVLLLWLVGRVIVFLGVAGTEGPIASFCGLAWQVGILLGLEQAYEVTRGRIVTPQSTDVAFLHAYGIFDFELRHGLFVEQRIQHLVLAWGPAMSVVDLFYVFAHVGVTLGVLIWVYLRHRDRYPFVRALLMMTTAAALLAFYLYPTAPPRFLTALGFVDPATTNHLVDAGGAQPDSYTYNPYAAMPSLHVAYALVAAWATLLATRRTWLRVVAVVYPGAMVFTVLASANHWVLDVIGAFVTVGVSAAAVCSISWTASIAQSAFARHSSPRRAPLDAPATAT